DLTVALAGYPLTCPPVFFFSSRRRHTRFSRDWSSDVCSSDLQPAWGLPGEPLRRPRGVRAVDRATAAGFPAGFGRREPIRCDLRPPGLRHARLAGRGQPWAANGGGCACIAPRCLPARPDPSRAPRRTQEARDAVNLLR